MENNQPKTKKDYYEAVNQMGKKEFTLLKMQEYGFWPKDLPTPYEKQKNETKEDYKKRKELLKEYEKIAKQIANLYKEKDKINEKLRKLKKQYNQTWDYEKLRKDVAQQIMQESIARRAERKRQKELEKAKISEAWKKQKAENIVFIGKGYSNALFHKETDKKLLNCFNLPIIKDDKELAKALEIEYKQLRFLTYHRDVTTTDHYHRYTIPKKSGGTRNIAAPKPILKKAQRKILELILEQIPVSEYAHGFLKGKSIVSGADAHIKQPELLINIDLENFFPTITFERVRDLFYSFGYSGYISSLLAMICTYCERTPIEIKGQIKYVKTSERILPQGAPTSPMITNILCEDLDEELSECLDDEYDYKYTYTRYADDISFSFSKDILDTEKLKEIMHIIRNEIHSKGFKINKKKTRFLRKNNRQCVTGIVINNEQLGVPKKWVKTMRAAIYNAKKLKEKGSLPSDTILELSGMASWLKSVNEKRYEKIIADAKNVLNN